MYKYILILLLFSLTCVNNPEPPNTSFEISIESDTLISINDTVLFTAQSNLSGDVRYVWNLDNSLIYDTTDTNILKFSWKMQDTGIHTISVSAFAGHANSALPVQKKILVNYYKPVVSLGPDMFANVNDTIVIRAAASDSDGFIKTYSWSVDPQGIFWTETGTDSIIWKWGVSDTGEQIVRVKVTDDDGLSSVDTVFVKINSTPPKVHIIPLDTVINLNDSITLMADAVDSNGSIVRYDWFVDGNRIGQNSQHIALGWSGRDTGEHKILVVVVDDDGLVTKSETALVKVHKIIISPTVELIPGDTNVFINDSVTFVANTTDSDGHVEKYIWLIDGFILQQNKPEVTLSWGVKDTGAHQISVSVFDDDGFGDTSVITKINVLSGAPRVRINTIPTCSSLDTVVVSCVASDTNGTVVKYFWYRDGSKLIDSTIIPRIPVHYYGQPLQILVCKVRDDDGLIGSDSISIRFNRPPSISVQSPQDTVFVGESGLPDTVKFMVSSFEPDSDSVSVELFTGTDFDSLNIVYQGKESAIPYILKHTGTTCWKIVVTDSWGNRSSLQGTFYTVLRHTICFVGHSIVEGMASDHLHGGFRKGVIDGLRDSLPPYERLKSVGSITTPEMRMYPADDSCLAISGTIAKEIYLLLWRGNPQLKADIWVLLLGVNNSFYDAERNNIIKIIDTMHLRNPESRIYVLNSPPVSDKQNDYEWLNNYMLPPFNRSLADSVKVRHDRGYNVYMIDIFTLLTKDSLFDTTWFADPLHPNQAGYDRMAQEILRVMYMDESMAIKKPDEN